MGRINKEPGSRGGSKQPSTRTGRSTGRRWRLAGRREEREGNVVRMCGLVVEAGCEGVKATTDWNHEIRWNGHAGHQVLVYERLLLQLLVLRRRERHHRPRGRPPRARLGVLLPQPAARGERSGAAEGDEGRRGCGGAVVGGACRGKRGIRHRHLNLSLSRAACSPRPVALAPPL